jgi:bacterioferritin (cytochrome b1)
MPSAPDGVINALQASVRLHLTAIENYQAQAEHFDRWGYSKLGEKCRGDVSEERDHLKKVMARLEYYDEQPAYDHDEPNWPRHDYEGILSANLELESAAMKVERSNVLVARAAGDELSAEIFAELLEGSEGSVAEIEAIQKVLEQIGVDNYLANQV